MDEKIRKIKRALYRQNSVIVYFNRTEADNRLLHRLRADAKHRGIAPGRLLLDVLHTQYEDYRRNYLEVKE